MAARAITVTTAFVILVGAIGAGTGSSSSAASSHVQTERQRLRAHFDSVLGELRDRTVDSLPSTQRQSRATLLAWLIDYRDAGGFPLNDRFGEPVPIFRDGSGTLCAMAYLVQRSGRRDIVERIARTRNNAYIHELSDDRALVAWLDSVGLDLGEAARIQPTYPRSDFENIVEKDNAITAMIMSGVSLVTATVNVLQPSHLSGGIGMISGAATSLFALSLIGLDNATSHGDKAIGTISMIAGGAALVAGTYGLMHPRSQAGAGAARSRAAPVVTDLRLRVAPMHDAISGRRLAIGISGVF